MAWAGRLRTGWNDSARARLRRESNPLWANRRLRRTPGDERLPARATRHADGAAFASAGGRVLRSIRNRGGVVRSRLVEQGARRVVVHRGPQLLLRGHSGTAGARWGESSL